MKMLLLLGELFCASMMYSMQLDEVGNKHRDKVLAIQKTLENGSVIYAYYSSGVCKTRVYIAYPDQTYERILIHADSEPEITNARNASEGLRLDTETFNCTVAAYDKQKNCIKLNLDQNN